MLFFGLTDFLTPRHGLRISHQIGYQFFIGAPFAALAQSLVYSNKIVIDVVNITGG